MKQNTPKPKSAARQWPYLVIFFGIICLFGPGGSAGLGVGLILLGVVPIVLRQMESRRIEQTADRAAKADAASKQAREAEEKRLIDEEERRFQADQAAMTQTSTYQRLHTQVNELLDYAHQLKRGGDNKMVLQATMDVIGRIATQHDLDKSVFEHEGIAADIRLFFDELKSAGLQNDMVYQRAVRVLRYQPPEGSTLRAVG